MQVPIAASGTEVILEEIHLSRHCMLSGFNERQSSLDLRQIRIELHFGLRILSRGCRPVAEPSGSEEQIVPLTSRPLSRAVCDRSAAFPCSRNWRRASIEGSARRLESPPAAAPA